MAAASPLSTAAVVAPMVSLAVTATVTIAASVSTAGFTTGNGYGRFYNGNGYGGVYDGNGYGGSGGFSGYASDPVGAEIPPMIFPTNCWVRRAAYDPSGAHMGQALMNLCHPSDNVTVTGLKARAKTPQGQGEASPASLYRSGAPQSPP